MGKMQFQSVVKKGGKTPHFSFYSSGSLVRFIHYKDQEISN
jgi:hypothetical protein